MHVLTALLTKTYQVKVTASTDGVIENKACFTGNSTANDNPQAGCDVADVKVTVPPAPVTPATPVTPDTPTTPAPTPVVEQPAVLPNTGMGANAFIAAGIASVLGFVIAQKRRA